MTRAAVTFLFVMFTVIIGLMIGIPMMEGVGEEVKTYDSVDESFDGSGMIDRLYQSVFVLVPLTLVGGFGLYAVMYYYRRESIAIGR
jgi:hypothetical protein